MEEKKLIEFRNIVKSFDSQVVLKGINLDTGEYTGSVPLDVDAFEPTPEEP